MKKLLTIASMMIMVGCITFVSIPQASAHPGRTDRYGCHTCKTNCKKWGLKYGQYHCHKKK